MPVAQLFDILLMLAGLVLVIAGLVMFIRSKTASAASSVEAFGIKLNVTHPSLILVLAGVGLMLAPRLLPELTDVTVPRTDPPVVAAAPDNPPTSADAAQTDASPPLPARPEPQAESPAAPPAAPATRPAPQMALPKPLPVAAGATAPAPKKPAAVPAPVSSASPPPPAPASQTAASEAAPAVAVKQPVLRFAALGVPISRAFWSGETRSSYTPRLHQALQAASRDILRMDARNLDLDPAAFDAWWEESNAHARSHALCSTSRALLAARVETSPGVNSSVESAYWPELRLRLYDCSAQRMYRQQKTLAPHKDDTWPFSVETHAEIERFLRTYRADLAGP
ncbi:MAG: hypothetical protein B7Y26_10040 [Hydrogenophilales bacterium 16-64-46]|nr:MAG: hypothetical protein B7Z32_05900 [Hydrogenophilales bacterium 12-64-13]OYZ04957.1 MAG: hypothetical protein B7Y26_10040 [Hydrogenophilales bacterium 16-64-46]OZA37601.1 MAG: hypothetical protein B7X87_10760 [Hydrogenophilales bacterium 17-64-34]HQT00871.1 hypothetical protein [Thiobacillus sp.]